MYKHTLEKILLMSIMATLSSMAEVDLQKGIYDAAEEMMQMDEKMNRLIAEHNQVGVQQDAEMRLNDSTIEDFEETESGYVLEHVVNDANNTKIDIKVTDGLLMLSTSTTKKETIVEGDLHSQKITERTSTTSLFLPHDADENTMKKHYENGVLKIEFLKKNKAI